MPLIRDYTHSEKVQRLSTAAEVLFVRLLLKADVAGNFYANPELIKSLCFPLKANVRTADIVRWLKELSSPAPLNDRQSNNTSVKTTALVRLYEVEGKTYLHIYDYGQKLKYAKAKFPKPPPEVKAELAVVDTEPVEVVTELVEVVTELVEVEAEEEIKAEHECESEKSHANNFSKMVSIEKDLTGNIAWLEKVCKSQKIKSVEACTDWLKKFLDEMNAKENFCGRPLADLKKHFVSWLKIEITKSQKTIIKTSLSDNPFWNYCPDVWDEVFYNRIQNENYADRKIASYEQKLRRNGYKKQGNTWIKAGE